MERTYTVYAEYTIKDNPALVTEDDTTNIVINFVESEPGTPGKELTKAVSRHNPTPGDQTEFDVP